MSSYEDVTLEVGDGVATVSLNRPAALNAFTAAMGVGMKRAFAAAAKDEAAKVIVLTGTGRGFCAGADMNLLQKITPGGTATSTPDFEHDFNSGLGPDVGPHYGGRFGYMLQMRKPVIAAINGPAAGLGLVLALYADIRFAASEAKLTTSFAQRGLIAEHGISWLLPRLIGPAQAFDLLFSARKLTAAEAERMGLVNRVFPQETFQQDVLAYARTLAQTVSPRSTAVMKAQVWKALHQDLNAALELANSEMQKSFASADFKEGIAHYVEKRAAAFTGA
jgi:enoyl-CoA hydratase/carnithine racemase